MTNDKAQEPGNQRPVYEQLEPLSLTPEEGANLAKMRQAHARAVELRKASGLTAPAKFSTPMGSTPPHAPKAKGE